MRKKKSVYDICLTLGDITQKIEDIPFAEDLIIEKSILFFSDPAPCFIHRGAVMTRLHGEIYDYFNGCSQRGINRHSWPDLPEHIQTYMSLIKCDSVYVKRTD